MQEHPPPLPPWVLAITQPGERIEDEEETLDATVHLAQASAKNNGGPFAAILKDKDERVISVGWNRVIEACDSTAHAEIEALRAAQIRAETHDLSRSSRAPFTLYVSCEPCVMCFGAIYWSGLARIVAAATADQAEAIGFDEGPVTAAMWEAARTNKNIRFDHGPTSVDPTRPFETYQAGQGEIY